MTTDSERRCACWMLPLHDGTSVPTAALVTTCEVQVHTIDRSLTGRILGACWAGAPHARVRYLIVEPAHDVPALAIFEGDLVHVDTSDADWEWVTEPHPRLAELSLRAQELMQGHAKLWVALGGGSSEALIELRPHECQPPRPARHH